MKVLFIHAHFDDYEFTASGTFEIWRRQLGEAFEAKVLVCTDGKAGHQFRTREETGRLRIEEQEKSAAIGRYAFELLRLPNGEPPREACLQVSTELLAALWKAIRDYDTGISLTRRDITDSEARLQSLRGDLATFEGYVAALKALPHD